MLFIGMFQFFSQGCLRTGDQLRGHDDIDYHRADPLGRVQKVLALSHTGCGPGGNNHNEDCYPKSIVHRRI